MIPRACTDEDAAYEPVRTVITVGHTGVRIIAVVTIGADRRSAYRAVDRSDANADAPMHLRMGITGGKKEQNAQKSCIFQIFHDGASLPTSDLFQQSGG